jgi:hypothetical protein
MAHRDSTRGNDGLTTATGQRALLYVPSRPRIPGARDATVTSRVTTRVTTRDPRPPRGRLPHGRCQCSCRTCGEGGHNAVRDSDAPPRCHAAPGPVWGGTLGAGAPRVRHRSPTCHGEASAGCPLGSFDHAICGRAMRGDHFGKALLHKYCSLVRWPCHNSRPCAILRQGRFPCRRMKVCLSEERALSPCKAKDARACGEGGV